MKTPRMRYPMELEASRVETHGPLWWQREFYRRGFDAGVRAMKKMGRGGK